MEMNAVALADRTLRKFKAAHVLQTPDGMLVNLDFNVSARNEEELLSLMADVTRGLSPSQMFPSAPEDLWTRYVATHSTIRRLLVPALPGMYKPLLLVLIGTETA